MMAETPPEATAAPDDRSLLALVAVGDRSALGALADRHMGVLFRYARSLSRDDATAEDAVQQAFIDVLRGAHTWDGGGTVRAWLLTVTRHAVYRKVRRRAGEPAQHVELHELAVLAGWGADPEQAAVRASDQALVRRALASIDPDFQEVIVLRDVEGLSGEEAAEVLGLTVAATKSRLHRARLTLAAALREEMDHGT